MTVRAQSRLREPSRLVITAPRPHLVQRRCACGGTPGPDGECAACRAKRLGLQQAARNAIQATASPAEMRASRQPGRLAASTARQSRASHDFSRMPVFAPAANARAVGNSLGAPDRAETPRPGMALEPDVDLAQNEPPTPAAPQNETPARVASEASTDVAEKPASCCKLSSFTVSGDSYTDTPTDTRKNIQFTVSVTPGSDPKKCVMVNWIQGTAKNKDGTFRKVKMFDKVIDYNFPTERIDSLDKDPVYASDSSGRWNYEFTVGTGDQFFTTDSPGPTTWVDGIDYDLKFRMCVYCIDDVSATSDETGSGVKNSLKCIPWVFKAKFDAAAGKFTH